MSIQPKDSGGGSGETRESVVTRQADDMLDKLPNDYVPHEVRKMFYRSESLSSFPWDARRKTLTFFVCVQVRARLQKMGALASMNIFLRQEIDRMQRVITLVRQTLTDLKLAIEGTIIMSEVFRNLLTLNEALFLSGCPICQWTAQLRNHHSKEKFDWRYVLVRKLLLKKANTPLV